MAIRIASIVEGHSEVASLPILFRRLASAWPLIEPPDFPTPIRVKRDRILNNQTEFNRYVELAALKAGLNGRVMLLWMPTMTVLRSLAQAYGKGLGLFVVICRSASCWRNGNLRPGSSLPQNRWGFRQNRRAPPIPKPFAEPRNGWGVICLPVHTRRHGTSHL